MADPGAADDPGEAADTAEGELLPAEPIALPIGDTLDLHSFQPRDVRDLVLDWLDAAGAAGWRDLLIVHGRGAGVQRAAVRSLLAEHPRVAAFGDAAERAGGATWLRLR